MPALETFKTTDAWAQPDLDMSISGEGPFIRMVTPSPPAWV